LDLSIRVLEEHLVQIFVFRGACADRGSPVTAQKLEYVSKNKDLHEVLLKDSNGKVQLRFVAAHGFRDVQNILKRLKRGEKIDFVEMMACPGGCLNGGGQLTGREKMEEMMNKMLNEINEEYYDSVRKAILDYVLKDDNEKLRIGIM
jgi:iron only hydrogenase large subunit-like protein